MIGAQRYFVAIIPGEPVYSEVVAIKKYFEQRHRSKAALGSPPHITLHMPFLWKENKEQRLFDAMQQLATHQQSFSITLKNFGAFPPRVIYIDLLPEQQLTQLQQRVRSVFKKELNLINTNYKDLPFHPHMTVAFRDLRKEEFLSAWKTFETKAFEASVLVNSIALLKHDGKQWHVYQQFAFH